MLLNSNNDGIKYVYTYDNNGNRISAEKMTVPGDSIFVKLGIYEDSDTSVASKDYYTYNELNQLMSVRSIGDSRNYRYAYLPNGLRYYKTDGTNYDYMYYDGDQICARATNEYNAFTHYYVFGLNRIKDNYGSHYVYNSHGDITKITNGNGAVVRSYDYDAFGVEKDESSTDLNPFRYCGEYYDTETGNIYLRARYYDPSIGSFITEDPARDGVNWYSYCAGNPVNYIDPSGMILKIVGTPQFTNDIIGYLTELTNYTFREFTGEGSEGVFVMIDGVSDNESSYVYSNQLVKSIINSGSVCTINESYSETNQVDYANKGEYGDLEELYAENQYNGIGISADIYINPTNFTTHMLGLKLSEEGLWESQLEEKPNPMIIVAHELVHAQRIMQGRAIDNRNGLTGEYSYYDNTKKKKIATSAYFEELVTVGLVDFGNQPINENSIRAEHGLSIRSVYSEKIIN